MAGCDLCGGDVEGESLLCEACRFDTRNLDRKRRRALLWGGAS